MGSLADLLLATYSDIPDIIASDYPLGTFKGTNVDGLDPFMLAALHVLLTETAFDELVDQYQPIAEASTEGPWLVRIPPELLAQLADVAPHDHGVFAARWAETEQLRAEGWAEEDVRLFLDALILHAQSMPLEEKELFLWTYG